MNTSMISTRGARTTDRDGFAGRWAAAAGTAYVAAWLAGLAIAPSVPADDAGVAAYYRDHATTVLLQSGLVHGVAGIALAIFAVAVVRALGRDDRVARWATGLGAAAALASAAQVGLAVAALGVASSSPERTAALVDAVDSTDAVKLVLLAGFVASATVIGRQAGGVPRWIAALATVTVVLLPLGGASFLVDGPLLTGMLYLSLPLLLAWVGAMAYAVRRA